MVWHGMVWYVSKHKHKKIIWERFGAVGAFGDRLNAFRTLWDRMGAFVRLGRLGSIIPYAFMVCK